MVVDHAQSVRIPVHLRDHELPALPFVAGAVSRYGLAADKEITVSRPPAEAVGHLVPDRGTAAGYRRRELRHRRRVGVALDDGTARVVIGCHAGVAPTP